MCTASGHSHGRVCNELFVCLFSAPCMWMHLPFRPIIDTAAASIPLAVPFQARALGVHPTRQMFALALFVGGITSWICGATTSFSLLVLARCGWGGCWSIIRLTGMLAVTDCVEAGVAAESYIGTMTGTASGITRLGSAVGMAAGNACQHSFHSPRSHLIPSPLCLFVRTEGGSHQMICRRTQPRLSSGCRIKH